MTMTDIQTLGEREAAVKAVQEARHVLRAVGALTRPTLRQLSAAQVDEREDIRQEYARTLDALDALERVLTEAPARPSEED